ncbi:cytochrome c oxidase assembly protein COX15 homolog [Saccostrea echinata]|uniref:cytochrome c oxidase assembly protein COX15 homolog n=1 Tax=Saccostrea echinata TaxID=191078 RepID=UPI002A806D14|nr:cytochrome c oxidase assembly protein COX15 homolog [Saccostrea echinata]
MASLFSVRKLCLSNYSKSFLSSRQMKNLASARCHFSTWNKEISKFLKKNKGLSLKTFQPFRGTTTDAAIVPFSRQQKIIGAWLFGCAGMCFGAVILGGVTRLTESGLSMVDWQLIKDMKPPRSQQEWEEEFERYKQYPEYQYIIKERDFTLSDFKFIYYMEYAHRMWGRMVGLVFLVPAAYFLSKGWVSTTLKRRLVLNTVLLGFQGFLGWYMVKSGLQEQAKPSDIPRVSQYRLASHLGSAFILYALFLWQGLTQFIPINNLPNTSQMRRLRIMAHSIKGLIFVTAISGAFVAGLDAGLTYNSWPKMADRWIPSDLLAISPTWKNFFENPTTVQFDHRHLAESTVVLIGIFWYMCRNAPLPPRMRMAVNALLGMGIIQASLGISTLLTYVPTPLAATHQSGSLILLSIAIWLTHEFRRLPIPK